jgi:hypothetical protein
MNSQEIGIRMTLLARTSSNCKQQTHPLVREQFACIRTMLTRIPLDIIVRRESKGDWGQDEMIDCKLPVVM